MVDLNKNAMLTIKQAAAQLGFSEKSIRKWTNRRLRHAEGKPWLECRKFGGRYRILPDAIDRFSRIPDLVEEAETQTPVAQHAINSTAHDEAMRRLREEYGHNVGASDASQNRNRRQAT